MSMYMLAMYVYCQYIQHIHSYMYLETWQL